MKITATNVENAICDYIRARGGWARKIHVLPIPIKKKFGSQWLLVGWRKNPKMVGLGDVYVMEKGITTRVEVKRPGDTESVEQKADRGIWERAGGPSLIVKDIDDFIKQYKRLRM
jgi:hypothetical protein